MRILPLIPFFKGRQVTENVRNYINHNSVKEFKSVIDLDNKVNAIFEKHYAGTWFAETRKSAIKATFEKVFQEEKASECYQVFCKCKPSYTEDDLLVKLNNGREAIPVAKEILPKLTKQLAKDIEETLSKKFSSDEMNLMTDVIKGNLKNPKFDPKKTLGEIIENLKTGIEENADKAQNLIDFLDLTLNSKELLLLKAQKAAIESTKKLMESLQSLLADENFSTKLNALSTCLKDNPKLFNKFTDQQKNLIKVILNLE